MYCYRNNLYINNRELKTIGFSTDGALGGFCSNNISCIQDNLVCSDNVCVCNERTTEVNGVCKSSK